MSLIHKPVLLGEILEFLPLDASTEEKCRFLDVTAGGGGHFLEILKARPKWHGECWDRDPLACGRIAARCAGYESRYTFKQKSFSEAPADEDLKFSFILADLGISSFQLDDPLRGLSFHSKSPVDFRMNPESGPSFGEWIAQRSAKELEEIFSKYGEELRAKKFSLEMKEISSELFSSAADFAQALMQRMHLRVTKNEIHPLTRVFQALRIAINDELGELEALLEWAPARLRAGGRLAIISFHSLEDRKVKRRFESWREGAFRILTPKALTPKETEVFENPRSRSAKLRVLERWDDQGTTPF